MYVCVYIYIYIYIYICCLEGSRSIKKSLVLSIFVIDWLLAITFKLIRKKTRDMRF